MRHDMMPTADSIGAAHDTEFAWLVEAPGPHYLCVKVIGRQSDFSWTPDANKALRFFDKAQADGVQYALHKLQPVLFAFAQVLTDAKSVEHGFSQL